MIQLFIKKVSVRILLIYIAVSIVWIFGTDYIAIFHSDNVDILSQIQRYKGLLFVFFSGTLIYLLVNREIKRESRLRKVLSQENKLQSILVKSLPDTDVIVFDHDLKITFFEGDVLNKLLDDDLKIKPKSIYQLPLQKWAVDRVVKFCHDVLKKENALFVDRYMGSYYDMRGSVLKDDQGKVIAGILTIIDITSHRMLLKEVNDKAKKYEVLYEDYQAQYEALQTTNNHLRDLNNKYVDSRNMYRHFLDHSNDGVFHVGFFPTIRLDQDKERIINQVFKNNIVVDCNLTFAKIVGMKMSESLIQNQLFSEFNANSSLYHEIVEFFLKNNCKMLNQEYELTLHDNKKLVVKCSAIGLIQDNNLVGVFGTVADITTIKEYEKNLIVQREKAIQNERAYVDLFNGLNDGVLLYELQHDLTPGKIFEANDEICKMLGMSKEQLLNRYSNDLLSDSEKIKAKERGEKHAQGESLKFEAVLIGAHENKIVAEVKTRAVNYHGMNLILAIIRDIRDRKEKERELQRERDRAKESDLLKSAFLANMSHEIRTPMNSIIGFSDMINDEDLTPDERQSYTEIIRSNSNNLLRIIDDILHISKIETKQLNLYYHKFPLNKLLNEIIASTEFLIKEKEKSIQLVHKFGLLSGKDKIFCDQERLRQVITNLCTNAVKFTQKGKIELNYYLIEDVIWFEISDTGIGIENDKQSKIFERFRQGYDGVHTRKYGGTGLGLSIAKGIVEGFGGEIFLESYVGKGSTFKFYIPYMQQKP